MDDTSFWSGLFLWLIIPPAATSILLKTYYSLRKKRYTSAPPQGSSTYKRHYRVANVVVLLGYFLYNMTNHVVSQKPSFYDVIGVRRFDVDSKLKTHFRQTVMNLHPDKTQSSDSSKFIEMKQIYETLNNEGSRIAYDCYGPNNIHSVSLSSSRSSARGTPRDFFSQALNDWMLFYGGMTVVTIIHFFAGRRSGFFLKFIGLMSLASFELFAMMRPHKFGRSMPRYSHNIVLVGGLSRFWDGIPFFRKIEFCRKCYTYLSLCFGQIYDMLLGDQSESADELLTKAVELSKSLVIKEVDLSFSNSFQQFIDNDEIRSLLIQKMGRVAVDLEFFDKLSAQERLRLSSRSGKKQD